MILYHVTHEKNLSEIKRHGVDPGKSRGKQHVAWWVEEHRISWAIEHVALQRDVCPRRLSIVSAKFDPTEVGPTRLPGVYTCAARKLIIAHWKASYPRTPSI